MLGQPSRLAVEGDTLDLDISGGVTAEYLNSEASLDRAVPVDPTQAKGTYRNIDILVTWSTPCGCYHTIDRARPLPDDCYGFDPFYGFDLFSRTAWAFVHALYASHSRSKEDAPESHFPSELNRSIHKDRWFPRLWE